MYVYICIFIYIYIYIIIYTIYILYIHIYIYICNVYYISILFSDFDKNGTNSQKNIKLCKNFLNPCRTHNQSFNIVGRFVLELL